MVVTAALKGVGGAISTGGLGLFPDVALLHKVLSIKITAPLWRIQLAIGCPFPVLIFAQVEDVISIKIIDSL